MKNYQHVIESFTFITGSKGVFDVKVDGSLLFSKSDLGRHAQQGEVLKLFRDLIGSETPVYPQK